MFRLVRKIDQRIIADRLRIADDFLARFRGLMFVPSISENEGLVLEPCSSIHMFFMRFPIDALFLDKNGVSVAIYNSLRPWINFSSWHRTAQRVVELKAGILAKNSAKLGEEFDILSNL
ncbi:MAG: DUF192 domain-containing protein [Candidatus Riflebacteria bacterium]|nr:DUF192 domain-containing protein [Candidatus Riflebacteria bacterium]